MPKNVSDYLNRANSEEKTNEWISLIRQSVFPRSQLRLIPNKCGLLIIDMQKYFVSPQGRCYLPAAPFAMERIKLLLDAWRSLEGKVFFTQHGHTGKGDLGMLGRFYKDYIKLDESDAEIVSELKPNAGEIILQKKTYDAFINMDLEAELKKHHLEQVLVTGVLTHLCCETTARAAFCRGFEVYMAADASASSTEALHLHSLLGLADGVAVIMKSAEIITLCNKQR